MTAPLTGAVAPNLPVDSPPANPQAFPQNFTITVDLSLIHGEITLARAPQMPSTPQHSIASNSISLSQKSGEMPSIRLSTVLFRKGGASRPSSPAQKQADHIRIIPVKYNKRGAKIEIRDSETVLHIKEKLMVLTRITPDYQILTQEDAKQSLGGDDRSNEQTISAAIGKKTIHLKRGISLISHKAERPVVDRKRFLKDIVIDGTNSFRDIRTRIFNEIMTRADLDGLLPDDQNITVRNICLIQDDKPLESFDTVRNGDTIEASLLLGEFPATPILPSHVRDLTHRRNHQATDEGRSHNGDGNSDVLSRLDCLKKWTKGELDNTNVGAPWENHFHPNGTTYYSHALDANFRVITDDKISHLPRLDIWAKRFHQHAGRLGLLDANHTPIDLYLALEDDNAVPYYYMVNIKFGQVFWFDRKPKVWIQAGDSLESALNCEFLAHVENFPYLAKQFSLYHKRGQGNSENRINHVTGYLRSSLVHSATEHILSPNKATSTLQIQDCLHLLELEKAIRCGHDHDEDTWYDDSSYETWFTARVLRKLLSAEQRRSLVSPEYSASPSEIIPEEPRISSAIELVLNLLSFYTFRGYKRRMQIVWSDKIITLKEWHTFLLSLLSDWQDSNLLATVIISANMGMLTLDLKEISRSLSFISTFFATTSIILGLHHSSRHRIALIFYIHDPLRGDQYFENVTRHHSRFVSDLFFPAFYLGLPWMLLLWSLIAFAFAIAIYHLAFQRSSMQTYALAGMAVIVLVCTLLFGVSPLFFRNILDPPHFYESDEGNGLRDNDESEKDGPVGRNAGGDIECG